LTNTLVQLSSVSLAYETPAERVVAAENVSLTVKAGELLAIMGTSGSGKTTLINVMAGLQLPDQGKVVVAGNELTSMSTRERAQARLRDIGVIFQDHNLIPEFSALENVALSMRAMGKSKSDADSEARELLRLVGLADTIDRRPAELSGGQKQRVGIARALSGGRKVILADEPTGSLDTTNSDAVFRLLKAVADRGVGVVVATHDPKIRDIATRTIHMEGGSLDTAVSLGAA